MGAVGLGLVVTLLLSGILMQTIAKPVRKMAGSVGLLVEGDLTVEIPGMNRKDELGSLARALDSFKALFEADKQRAEAEAMRARETEETINAIGAGLSALAKGQLTHRVDENANGPLAKLYNDYNDALSHLQDAMVQIVEGCNTIKNGTNEIAQASSDPLAAHRASGRVARAYVQDAGRVYRIGEGRGGQCPPDQQPPCRGARIGREGRRDRQARGCRYAQHPGRRRK